MHKITLSVTNPITGDSEVVTCQFDAATFNEAEWAKGFPLMQGMLDKLTERTTDKEPLKWGDAATAILAKPPI